MTVVRPPAVAGAFYPGDPVALAAMVDEMLADASRDAVDGRAPKALIAPHAGYVYSGAVAAAAYARLAAHRDTIRRVVLVGPAHRVALFGAALPSVDAFRTPLGDVPVDSTGRDALAGLPAVVVDDGPHADEHSLEVHLPFLQRVLPAFSVLPIVVGRVDPDSLADVLDRVWGGRETVVVVSSDLSHYESLEAATVHDTRTVAHIIDGATDAVGPDDACGAYPVRALMRTAAHRGLRPWLLDRRTSGDTAGPRDRVVGYAAIAYAGAQE